MTVANLERIYPIKVYKKCRNVGNCSRNSRSEIDLSVHFIFCSSILLPFLYMASLLHSIRYLKWLVGMSVKCRQQRYISS